MVAVIGLFVLLTLPAMCGLASYGRHRSVVRAGFAAIGGLLILPAIVGALCAAGVRPTPRNEWS